MAIDQAATLTGSSSLPITEVCVLLDWADVVVAAGGQAPQLEVGGIRAHREPTRFAIADERATGLWLNQRHVELAGGFEVPLSGVIAQNRKLVPETPFHDADRSAVRSVLDRAIASDRLEIVVARFRT